MFKNLAKFFINSARNFSCETKVECNPDKCLCLPPKTKLGAKAPDFKKMALLPDGKFGELKLDDFKGSWLTLVFYPLDFTFVCPTELMAYSDNLDKFTELNCKVVAASVDSHFSHAAWAKQARNKGGVEGIKIPMISDLSKTMSRDYGVLNDGGLALRGVFIIDPKSNLRQITINETSVGRSTDETLRLLSAIQHVDKHGVVCPINFKAGAKAMKASAQGIEDYFKDE